MCMIMNACCIVAKGPGESCVCEDLVVQPGPDLVHEPRGTVLLDLVQHGSTLLSRVGE